MRRPLLGLLAFFVLLICSTSLKSQTTLAAGDIAITGYNADNPDQYMVVLLVPVTANTVVNFTDNGWFASGSFRANEGVATLTFTTDAPAGTEIQIEGSTATFSNCVTGTIATSGSIAFAGGGDQLLVYQGTQASPVFITALSMEGGAWQADATSAGTSALPTGLTNGLDAFALAPEIDNALYNRAVTGGTSGAVLAAVYTTANWTTSNTVPFTQDPICYFGSAIGTALAPGDIAITGYNADNPDQYMIVLLAPVVSGTVINFTDNGWFASGSFRANEGVATLTFTSAAPMGTEIQIEGTTATFSNSSTGTITTSGSIAFSNGGDQLFVYQGTQASPKFITGLSMEGGTWQADATSAGTSALPACLTNGLNAFALAPEVDNALYNRTLTTGTAAGVLAAIYTTANWTTDNGSGIAQTPMEYFAPVVVVPADTPTLGGTANISPGANGMVNVTAGNLNDATVWVLFTGSCGGTEIARNATGMFTVTPTATTQYFVGGESSAGLAMCASFTINVVDTEPPVLTIPGDMNLSTCDLVDPSVTGIATATDNSVMPLMIAPWINEIHYDDDGGDAMEGIEIAGLAGTSLNGWSIEAYNGNNNSLYDTEAVSGTLADNGNGYGTLFIPISGLQNGGSDGIALIDNNGVVVQFLSYEGVLTPINGTANGMTSQDIGVAEGGSAAEGSSLQLEGSGSSYTDFTWIPTADVSNTFGATNTGQSFIAPVGPMVSIVSVDAIIPGACPGNFTIERTFTATDDAGNATTDTQTIIIEDNEGPIIIAPADMGVSCLETDLSPANTGGAAVAVDPCTFVIPTFVPFFNELNYDNSTANDVNEFIEIAAPSGTNLTGYMVVPYNGSNGTQYNPVTLSAIAPLSPIGVGFVKVPLSGIQNGAPDGVALVDAGGTVIEFISYEGSFTANNGPASGMTSTDIGVFEAGGSAPGLSLQLIGNGLVSADFTWSFNVPETDGAVNQGQSFASGTPLVVTTTDSDDGVVLTRTFTATDACGNMTEKTQIITRADLAPRIECRQPTSTCNSPGMCGNDQITLLPPFVFDDCGFGSVATITTDALTFYPIGTTVVTWTVTNGTGSSQCESLVIITDEEAPSVECLNEGIVNIHTQDPNSCTAQINLSPVITDNCSMSSLTVTGTGNYSFSPGLYIHPVTATDAAGNSTTCDYEIYVHDTFAPTVTNCPGDLTVSSAGDLTPVFLPQPSAIDNCGGVEITSDAPEDGFPVGTTTVNFMIEDGYGNLTACSYDVIVSAPITFSGLNDVEASLEEENTTARVTWNEPLVKTSCAICTETEIEDYRYIGVYRGHQYFLYKGGNTTWSEAELMAEMLDAQLVTINTESENRFLKNALNEDFSSAFTGLTQTTFEEEIVMNWLTYETVDFTNFDAEYIPTEEANVGLMQADGTWILVDNTVESTFLVERPCSNFEQISPVLIEMDEETGELISETLLTCGSDFTEGTYVVTYRATDICGNEAEINFDVVVEMPTATTCTAGSTESSLFIDKTLIGGYEMATGDDAGFGDYTEEEMVLYAVIDEETEEYTPVPMNITAGGANGTEELFYRIWLDTNHDGDFFDADEMLAETMTTSGWNFELPAFEENMDPTRMRIMVSKYDYPEVCGEVAQGETEDYTVSILQTIVRPGDDEDTRGDDNDDPIVIGGANDNPYTGIFDLFPNPAKESVSLNLKGFIGQNVDLTVTNQLGQVIKYQKLTDVQTSRMTLDVRAFAAGIYGVSVLTEGGEMQTVKLIVK